MTASLSLRPGGDVLGCHRVLAPLGRLPQAADVLDASLPIFETEALLDVDCLNIDAASFTQLESTGEPIEAQIAAIVERAGKMHNPVTGSGGMLLGRVRQLGPRYDGPLRGLPVGTPIATLVSLTLTPLHIEKFVKVHRAAHQVEIVGHAILPPSAPAAAIPSDMPPELVLSVLDVCGAPALIDRLARRLPQGAHLVCIGAGKAGTLSLAAARAARPDLKLWALDRFEAPLLAAHVAGLCDGWRALDATDALAVRAAVQDMTGGELAHAVVLMTSLPGTEMAAILSTRQRGTCFFFGMATSFTRVALGAEGVGADIELYIGNGYAEGHAQLALELVRQRPALRPLLSKRV